MHFGFALDLLDTDSWTFCLSTRRLEEVLKICLEEVLKTCLQDIFPKTCLQDVLKKSSASAWRHLQDVLKTSSRCLEDQQMFAGVACSKRTHVGQVSTRRSWINGNPPIAVINSENNEKPEINQYWEINNGKHSLYAYVVETDAFMVQFFEPNTSRSEAYRLND